MKLKKIPWQTILFILLGLFLSLSLVRNIGKIKSSQRRVDRAKERVEKLRAENERLTEELKKVETDEFIEKQLRDKLGLAKEGEVVIVLPDAETLKKLAPQIPQEEEELPPPIWKKWFALFNL